jgi:hypothetical protein
VTLNVLLLAVFIIDRTVICPFLVGERLGLFQILALRMLLGNLFVRVKKAKEALLSTAAK